MARKKWVAQKAITPELVKGREKRKWQIAFRRYVIERKPSLIYAPYFGLEIQKLRDWIELQFDDTCSWENFGSKWQFDHVIPVGCFDLAEEAELRLCWSFINIRVKHMDDQTEESDWIDLLRAKNYFTQLFQKTELTICQRLIDKIMVLESFAPPTTAKQEQFLISNKAYLHTVSNYSAFEFDLLNHGKSSEEVGREVDFLKKF